MRSVSKAPVGFGMVVNPDYNRGRPYYVNFRPILHAVRRLSPEELDRYYKADERVEEIKYKLKRLEERGVDVFDLRIELGLATRKLEEASFDMVAAYLDSLEPRVEDICARHGLKGIKREIELRPESEIKRAQMAAIKEREARLAKIKRPPEIVEAYRELLAPKKEVVHAPEVEKPLAEEEEMLHPEARKELERQRRAEARRKKAEEKKETKPEAEEEAAPTEAGEEVEVEKAGKPEKIEIGERAEKTKGEKATNGGSRLKAGRTKKSWKGEKAMNGGTPMSVKRKNPWRGGRKTVTNRSNRRDTSKGKLEGPRPRRGIRKNKRVTNGGTPSPASSKKQREERNSRRDGCWLDAQAAKRIYKWLEEECGGW
jgi:hypothetical protein